MLNPLYVENAPHDGSSVLEILSQPDSDGRLQRQFVPLRDTRLVGEIIGPLASLQLQQTFLFSRADCDRTIEAAYRFPLPGDAAVLGVRIAFGEVEIEAQLRERQQAETEYREAKEQGKQAALLTRESPDVFTLQVAGIAPDEPVVIETRYVQLVRLREKSYELRIPLTTAPRYTRTDEADSRHAQGQPLAVLRDPGHRFEMFLQIHGATNVSSSTHELGVRQSDGTPEAGTKPASLQVLLREGQVMPNRDCVLEWQTATTNDRPCLQAWSGRDGDDEYFLALLSPPQLAPQEKIAREVVVLVDHSGSMNGTKWIAADQAVENFLRNLAPTDYFALGIFHSQTKWLSKRLVAARPETIGKAIDFVNGNQDSGGTELGVALEQALHFAPALHTAARHVFVITDGEVTDDGRILQVVQEQPFPQHRRISVLCIDTAPNSYLVQEITERTGGVARFLGRPETVTDNRSWLGKMVDKIGSGHSPANQLTASIDEIMRDWEAPLHLGVQIRVNRSEFSSNRQLSQVNGGHKNVIDAGDFPVGRPVWIIGRANAQEGPLELHATDAKGAQLDSATAEPVADAVVPALKALFGSKPVLELEYMMQHYYHISDLENRLQRMGLTMPAPRAIYTENQQDATRDAIRRLLVQEALRYGLVCAETAFIAVRHDANRRLQAEVTVANALPDQWDARFAGAFPVAAGSAASPIPAAPPMVAAPAATMDWMAQEPVTGMLDSLKPVQKLSRTRSVNKARQQAAPPPTDADAEVFMLDDLQEEGYVMIFKGIPSFTSGHALLFDSSKLASADAWMALRRLPQMSRLRIRFSGNLQKLPADMQLQIRQNGEAQPIQQIWLYIVQQQSPQNIVPANNLLVQANELIVALELPSSQLQSLQVELISGGGWKAELGNLVLIVE